MPSPENTRTQDPVELGSEFLGIHATGPQSERANESWGNWDGEGIAEALDA